MAPKQKPATDLAWPLFLPSPESNGDKTTLSSLRNLTHDDIKTLMNFYNLTPQTHKAEDAETLRLHYINIGVKPLKEVSDTITVSFKSEFQPDKSYVPIKLHLDWGLTEVKRQIFAMSCIFGNKNRELLDFNLRTSNNSQLAETDSIRSWKLRTNQKLIMFFTGVKFAPCLKLLDKMDDPKFNDKLD